MKIPTSLAFLVTIASAQSIIESSSFGHGASISQDRSTIPGWQINGEGHRPLVLSNKIILTPGYPGNARGSAWSQSPLSQSEWTAELQFRANGPERAGGNLQLWYTKDGSARVGSSSIYTVGPFDGFALAIDSHGGRGGSVRGFLNDGTTDYSSHRSVDSLAFGHCEYHYRNLGRPSVVRVKHTNAGLEVTVDDKLCFQTDKIALPSGNTFGITAATPENPDSFELFKFVVQTAESGTAPPQQRNDQQQQQQQQPPLGDQIVDDTQFRGSDSRSITQQFVNLDNRLQGINKATSNVIREMSKLPTKNDVADLLQRTATRDQVANLDARLARIEQMLTAIQKDLQSKDYNSRFNQLQETLRSSHLTLRESLQESLLHVITAATPRMGFFIFLVISFQLLLAGSYIIYKRRRANMPKKFL